MFMENDSLFALIRQVLLFMNNVLLSHFLLFNNCRYSNLHNCNYYSTHNEPEVAAVAAEEAFVRLHNKTYFALLYNNLTSKIRRPSPRHNIGLAERFYRVINFIHIRNSRNKLPYNKTNDTRVASKRWDFYPNHKPNVH